MIQKPTAQTLRAWYLHEGQTAREIADRCGCNANTVLKWLHKAGIPVRRSGPQSGDRHPGWKGGRTIDKTGYVLVYSPDHPHRNRAGYVREHRLVMERVIGRYLERTEVVHHKDGDRQNNSPDNLQLFSRNSDHLRHELTGKCPQWSAEGKRRIREASSRDRALIDVAELRRLHAKGCSMTRCAALLGHSRDAIQRKAKRVGLVFESQHGRSTYDWPPDDVLVEWYKTMPLSAIGERVGCSGSAVRHHLRRLGVPRRGAGMRGVIELRKQLRSKSTDQTRQQSDAQAS